MKTADGWQPVSLPKPHLQKLVDELRLQGFRVIGPTLADGAIVYSELDSIEQLPVGIWDEQEGGHYRLVSAPTNAWFEFVVGPHSLKNFTFPARQTVLEGKRDSLGNWQFKEPVTDGPPMAVLGIRACDLAALAIQDRIFMKGDYCDANYSARRQRMFLIAVNCQRAAATCFCHSMNCGPKVTNGYDLALTELEDEFVVEVGSQRGFEMMQAVQAAPASTDQIEAARTAVQSLARRMAEGSRRPNITAQHPDHNPERSRYADAVGQQIGESQRHLETEGIRELLYNNLNHPRWDQVAERCLSCGNCTMVCPTCFCSKVEDVPSLDESEIRRERVWASCFTDDHSYMNSGVVRQSIRSRYRQWLTHKLGGWIDQFGISGCVGCGRCITWCPVGIDLTEEIAGLRGDVTSGGHESAGDSPSSVEHP
ncbi:MAG TPA: 4Fe-4S dicluster domain-containing protein [Pirellulaceae bacterium]|nr:4Fe-4S dicluster domain-containing protein [Pirellulaceae bacterium]HMO91136.1 4Fe-4S dicluster domain-containing protein [Pirellulaceae bacterium]HMP69093.1 4Fe-4S dicluster domain-containing protein [Pirellulaceae bacterium]